MSEISMNLQEQIAFCEEKSKNIKLKTEPQTFINIKANLEKLEKIEQIFEIKEFGEYPSTYEDMCREVIKIVKG